MFKVIKVIKLFKDCWGDPHCGEIYNVEIEVNGKRYELELSDSEIRPLDDAFIKDLDMDKRAKIYAALYRQLFPDERKSYSEVIPTAYEEALANALEFVDKPLPEPRVAEFEYTIDGRRQNARFIVPGAESVEVVDVGRTNCQLVDVGEDPFSFLHRRERELVCKIVPEKTKIVTTRPISTPSDAKLRIIEEPDKDKNMIIRILRKAKPIIIDHKNIIKALE